jgi:hypothetical protein
MALRARLPIREDSDCSRPTSTFREHFRTLGHTRDVSPGRRGISRLRVPPFRGRCLELVGGQSELGSEHGLGDLLVLARRRIELLTPGVGG